MPLTAGGTGRHTSRSPGHPQRRSMATERQVRHHRPCSLEPAFINAIVSAVSAPSLRRGDPGWRVKAAKREELPAGAA